MAKKLNVSLEFSADTSKARQEIYTLQQDLHRIAMSSGKLSYNSDDLKKASSAAQELQLHLKKATNPNTGKLDLSRFVSSLNRSNKDLKYFQKNLSLAGVEGEEAFLKLARDIAQSEAPALRLNKRLQEMGNTIKNTARWQISSSILHGFMGTMQKAYGYAQDLNKSLNDIRIVTGLSTEQMDKFAVQANKAAKALSTSTLAYTDAALIYYQQGLNSEQVRQRTDVTMKMSNVTGESAEDVSSYMTAVWNNFDDGSKSLEYYADVMTKLGAATAASSEEIAGGLEKFAAIGNTVGLSYEYATSALATIVDKTRQSEEVVGTALKTIFSRIQGLKLGDTLEDGTDLNKYSQALLSTGVSIKNANGELKDMDTILDEIGAKWKTLHRDEKMALAQSVAGVRQYNQFISLMDNYDAFKTNVGLAETSTGELQKQADIYAESWEGAKKRVRAAMEDVFGQILSDDFFIKITNGIASLTNALGDITQALGGIKGITLLVSSLFLKKFAKEMPHAMHSVKDTFFGLTKEGAEQNKNILEQSQGKLDEYAENHNLTLTQTAQIKCLKQITALKKEMIDRSHELTIEERKRYEQAIENYELLGMELEREADILTKKKEKNQEDIDDFITKKASQKMTEKNKGSGIIGPDDKPISQQSNQSPKESEYLKFRSTKEEIGKAVNQFNKLALQDNLQEQIKGVIGEGREKIAGKTGEEKENIVNIVQKKIKILEQLAREYGLEVDKIVKKEEEIKRLLDNNENIKFDNDMANELGEAEENLKQLGIKPSEISEKATAQTETFNEILAHRTAVEGMNQSAGEGADEAAILADTWGRVGASFLQVQAIITSFNSTWSMLTDETTSGMERIVASITFLGTSLSILNQLLSANNLQAFETIGVSVLAIGTRIKESMAINSVAAANLKEAATEKLLNKEKIKGILSSKLKVSNLKALLFGLGAVTLAIITLVGVIKLTKTALESTPAGRYKKLKKEAEDASAAFDRVNSSIQETKNKLDELTSTTKGLEQLTKGTNEWKESVQKVNNIVLSLLDKYPELMKYIYKTEDGVLGISSAGQDYISNADNARLSAANNRKLETKQDQLNGQLNVIRSDHHITNGTYANAYIYEVFSSAYEHLGESVFSNAEVFEEVASQIDTLGDTTIDFTQEAITAEKNSIIEYSKLRNEFDTLSDMKIESHAQSIGSTRSSDEFQGLLGNRYKQAYNTARNDASKKFGNWNDHLNYDASDAEWSEIQRFMTTQGDNVEYVAQRHGNMVLNVDGEEKAFSADDVYDTLAELDLGAILKGEAADAIRENFEEGFNNVNFDKFDDNAIIHFDNLRTSLTRNLEEGQKDLVDKSLGALLQESKNNPESFNSLFEGLDSIDYNNVDTMRQLSAAVSQLGEDAEGADKFVETLREINAQGKIMSMSGVFSGAAKDLGLKEEDAKIMQEYARNLMEVSKEDDELADSLAKDAESAADLAIEVTRMNKGIETLAENSEDWIDILKNSSKTSYEYAEAMVGMKDGLADVLDVESDLISSNFVEDHLDEIAKAANGDADAIDGLRSDMDEEIIANISMGQTEEFQNALNQVDSTVRDLAMNLPDIEVGAILQDEDFLNAANNLVNQAGMTADEANAYFAGIGYEPVYNTEEIENGMAAPNMITTASVSNFRLEKMGEGLDTRFVPTFDVITSSKAGEPTKGEGDVRLTSFSGGTKPPTIRGFRKKASGSMNNYSSINSGGKPAKGGKGGGGKSKSKDLKVYKDEKERYHEIKNTLEDLGKEYDKLGTAKDRAFGGDKLNYMDQEIEKMDQIIDAQKQYRDEIRTNLSLDKGTIAGYGATFDNKGNINNYDEMLKKQVDKYNAAVTAYNKGSLSEEAMEQAEKHYEAFQKALKQYEETHDLWLDSEQDLIDKENERYDLKLEKVQYTVEIKIDAHEDTLEFIEYLLDKLDDDAYDAAEAISLLGKQVASTMGQIDAWRSGLLGIFDNHGLSESDMNKFLAGDPEMIKKLTNMNFTEDEVEYIRETKNNLLEANKELMELRNNVHERVREAFSALADDMDKCIEKIEHMKNVTESYRDIVELVGQDYLGITDEMIAQSDKAMQTVATNQLIATKSKLDALVESREKAAEALAQAELEGNEEGAKKWRETIEEMDSQITDARENFMSAWNESLQVSMDNFERSIERAIKKFEKKLSGEFKNFENLQDAFDKKKEFNEFYIQDYKKIYELSKLTRDVNNSIDDTDSIRSKQELKELNEEIYRLQESGVKLSQYDIDNLRRRYELKLAELALDESRDAKSQVRMQRDLAGNWGYVYTADENAVADAEQNYEDKLYAMQQANYEYIQEVESTWLELQARMLDDMRKINPGDYASREEYELAIQKIADFYQGMMNMNSGELEKVLNNNQTLYAVDWKGYSDLTNYKISADDEYIDKFNETVLSQLTGFQTMQEGHQAFNDAVGSVSGESGLLYDSSLAFEEWSSSVATNMEAAGTSVENFKDDYTKYTDQVVTDSEKAAKSSEDMKKKMTNEMSEIIKSAQDWEKKYGTAMNKVVNHNEAIITSFNNLIAAWSRTKTASTELKNTIEANVAAMNAAIASWNANAGDGGDNDGGGYVLTNNNPNPPSSKVDQKTINNEKKMAAADNRGSGSRGKYPEIGSYVYPKNGQAMPYYKDSSGVIRMNPDFRAALRTGIKVKALSPKKKYLKGDNDRWYLTSSFKGYKTGGLNTYTGPAWLDGTPSKPELVLNSSDTKNLLSAVDIIREISHTIDLNAANASNGLNSLLKSPAIKDHNNTVEQEVTIHAEFPNATNHNEIEEAFDNIINRASQYANRQI